MGGEGEDLEMRFGKMIAVAAASLALTSAAFAWNSDDKGNIKCADSSNATAVQQSDNTWTVTVAGTKGKTGGSFATEGKAALAACGEG
jgi:hypothetical protein